MRKTALIATLLALPIACSPPATEELEPSPEIEAIAEDSHVSEAEHALHWDYGEEVGPAQWGGLSPDFAMCDEGMMQSPIDIAGPFADVEEMDLRRDFKPVEMLVSNQPSSVDLLDNGHTIQVSFDEGNAIQVGETSFELAQYHFHAPSEHTLEGRHFPMEVHFVHVSEDGILAVAGAFIDEGAHNAAFDPIWNSFPVEVGESRYLEGHDVDLDSLVPAGSDYYRYIGSLTTPPCSEGVNWIVRTEPLTLSAEQIAAFTAIINNNNRPTQPLNGRVITTGSPSYVE